MGSRMLTGNTEEHIELEKELAAFLREARRRSLFNYGYLGVLGTICSLVGPDDVVIIDSLSHASMVDATILASAGRRFRPFKHNDMEDLESHLKAANKDRKGGILIVTEGVFGMQGDLADLPGICALKERYGARLFVDDAHGFGVMGANGRGTGEHLGVQDQHRPVLRHLRQGLRRHRRRDGRRGRRGGVDPLQRAHQRVRQGLPHGVRGDRGEGPDDRARPSRSCASACGPSPGGCRPGSSTLGFDIGDTESPITPVYVPAGSEQTGHGHDRACCARSSGSSSPGSPIRWCRRA